MTKANFVWNRAVGSAWEELGRALEEPRVTLAGREPLVEALVRDARGADGPVPGVVERVAAGRATASLLELMRAWKLEWFGAEGGLDWVASGPTAVGGIAFTRFAYESESPYCLTRTGTSFVRSPGGVQRVRSLFSGLRACRNAQGSAELLYASGCSGRCREFAVDLCAKCPTYRIVVAATERGKTLREMIDRVNSMSGTDHPGRMYAVEQPLSDEDLLEVPLVDVAVVQRLSEMEGNGLAGAPGITGYLDFVVAGVKVVVGSRQGPLASSGAPEQPARWFRLDEPFLLYVGGRRSEVPAIVIWVGNASLLVPEDDNS